ncbi:Multidrug MFS transporter [Candidatus Roizmanbacteria bacterium]|nr:Multidrug MFS transporter [Candidatus Roizmanbacteria bacterium]
MISFAKKTLSLLILIVLSPFILLFFLLIRLTSQGPFIFKQKRLGKDKKPFILYKIRTMVTDAENLKSRIANLNEADGPVFKIKNDPRYTKIGKFLSHTGLDEVPQLVNIIKGEMDFVGPRPLPVMEANKVPKKYERRFSILPGMTSPWIIRGAHNLTFAQWMQFDMEYIDKKNPLYDFLIFSKTLRIIILLIIKNY